MIRTETESDYEEVYNVIQRAFETAEETDHNEHNLVVSLRTSDRFVPELSLVAEHGGRIIGHILFTKIRIGNHVELALAPLSVAPEHQRQGVGLALMQEGHKRAKELGFRFSVVLGSERYYPKAGYVPAARFGIRAPFDVPEHNYMALNLRGEDARLDETVDYAKEFGL